MSRSADRWRVAVVGASSLLGKEVVTVLEERKFPVSRLVRLAAPSDEPDLPVLDLNSAEEEIADDESAAADLDLVFLASPLGTEPVFLRGAAKHAPAVVDLGSALKSSESAPLRIPSLEGGSPRARQAVRVVSPHPAAIVLSTLLLRLSSAGLTSAVAEVFVSASELGARAVEELQKQTVNLLSFQKIPSAVFGAQLTFNLLPRLGTDDHLKEAGGLIQAQLARYLADRVPLPAVRVLQTPAFHSLAVSLYVETAAPAALPKLAALLSGGGVKTRRAADHPASQVEVAGSDEILVDVISADAARPAGVWLWAVVDNLRLAAVNAVAIAEELLLPRHQGSKSARQ
jgi:aspartate-semialdehyde dehydrogenase